MVQGPYLTLAVVVILVALAIALVRLPTIESRDDAAPSGMRSLFTDKALMTAVLAQFFYVGAQVGIWSFFVDFVKEQLPNTPERTAAFMLSGSLVLFMTGRFVGTMLMARVAAPLLLFAFAVINVVLCATAALTSGAVSIAALGLTGFFMSIMFPTIFSLGIRTLGARATLGSSLIIMAIIGGAIFPPLMGLVSRASGGVQLSLVLPMASFAVVALYARYQRTSPN